MPALLRTAETVRLSRDAMISMPIPAPVSSRSCFSSADDHILAALGLLNLLISTWNEGEHPQRTARAVDDLQGRRDQHRAGRRQLIEIHQARETEAVRAVHDRV